MAQLALPLLCFVGIVVVSRWSQTYAGAAPTDRPNIVIVVADDLGWNDVSFHGSNQIPTPNLDALAYDGVVLNRHYVPPLCTPSRASLMTGKHPINIGMQNHVIISDEPWGLGLDQKLMPEYFRDAGYRTHLVGKWHLGFFRKAYTPTQRGFESHFGYIGPYIDYWDHSLQMNKTSTRGRDMRRNLDVDYSVNGTYATDLFNDEAVRIVREHAKDQPLFLVLTHLAPHTGNEEEGVQAPAEEVRKYSYIQNEKRRTLAAMISKIDEGVGKVYRALDERQMLQNTIILFYTDNGAPTIGVHANFGSNYPLRGQKYSPWEGAVRGAAAIWSPLLPHRGRVSEQWMHVSDWLPTLAHAAGIRNVPQHSEIDGRNQWELLQNTSYAGRSVIMNNAEQMFFYSSYIKNGWKYVNGSSFDGYDDWLGALNDDDELSDQDYYSLLTASPIGSSLPLELDHVQRIRRIATVHCDDSVGTCKPKEKACLFNLLDDPCERHDLSAKYPHILSELQADVDRYRATSAKPRNRPSDPRADPANFNHTWTWWQDELDAQETPLELTLIIGFTLFVLLAVLICMRLLSRPCYKATKLQLPVTTGQ